MQEYLKIYKNIQHSTEIKFTASDIQFEKPWWLRQLRIYIQLKISRCTKKQENMFPQWGGKINQ